MCAIRSENATIDMLKTWYKKTWNPGARFESQPGPFLVV